MGGGPPPLCCHGTDGHGFLGSTARHCREAIMAWGGPGGPLLGTRLDDIMGKTLSLKVKKLGRSYTHTHTPLCGPHLPCQKMTHRVQVVYAVRVAPWARALTVAAGPNKERCTFYQLLAFCRRAKCNALDLCTTWCSSVCSGLPFSQQENVLQYATDQAQCFTAWFA